MRKVSTIPLLWRGGREADGVVYTQYLLIVFIYF